MNTSVANGYASATQGQTQLALQMKLMKMNAQADQNIVSLLQEGLEGSKAPAPAGMGGAVDVSA